MSDSSKDLPPIRPSEEGWRSVHRIEGYKQGEPTSAPLSDTSPTLPLFLYFVSLFKTLMESAGKKRRPIFLDVQNLIQDLQTFYDTIKVLIHQDTSHDPVFTQTLSLVWHKLVDDCNQLIDAYGHRHPVTIKFKVLLDEVSLYPPWEEHSLGYYLHRRAGGDWIPVPFMEILLALHISAKKNPFNNPLEKWQRLAEEIKQGL